MEINPKRTYNFGVRSYLDKFYHREGTTTYTEPSSDSLLNSSMGNSRYFFNRWLKFLFWVSLFLIAIGLFLLVLNYILPRKQININSRIYANQPHVIIVDRQALAYNTYLDRFHIYGLGLILFGSVLFIIPLLVTALLGIWYKRNQYKDEAFSFKMPKNVSGEQELLPIGSFIETIQPISCRNESRITGDGMVSFSAS